MKIETEYELIGVFNNIMIFKNLYGINSLLQDKMEKDNERTNRGS